MRLFFIKSILVLGAIIFAQTGVSNATTIFSDDFTAGADAQWLNAFGDWEASGGTYEATILSNNPNANSLVDISLTDFEVNVTVSEAGASSGHGGGIWLRSSNPSANTVDGVLFVWANGGMYWHDVTSPSDFSGGALNIETNVYDEYDDFSLRIVVQGDSYSAFLNGSSVAVTTLISNSFSSGFAGLYSFQNGQTFDNFSIESVSSVPVPAALPLFGSGLFLLGVLSYRRKRRNA